MLQIKLKNPIGKIVNIQGGRYRIPSTISVSNEHVEKVTKTLQSLDIKFDIIKTQECIGESQNTETKIQTPEVQEETNVELENSNHKNTEKSSTKKKSRKTKKQGTKNKSKTKK